MSDCLTFAAGQVATLTAQFVTSPAGTPINVPDPEVAVFLGDQEILPASTMIHVMTGFYFFDWTIPNSLPPNTYTARFTGTVQGLPTAGTSLVKVLPSGTPSSITNTPKQIELIAALETYLGCAQAIHLYQ